MLKSSAPVKSLIATISQNHLNQTLAEAKRPIRPKPLIAIFTAILFFPPYEMLNYIIIISLIFEFTIVKLE